MSGHIHRADLAVSTDGTVFVNVTPFDEDLDAAALVKLALAQRGELFIGVSLSTREVRRLVRGVGLVLPNLTGPLVGRRLRLQK